MAISPEKTADDSVFKYCLSTDQLPAAQAQIKLAFGTAPVLMIVNRLDQHSLELLVMAPALSPSQAKFLTEMHASNLQLQALPSSQMEAQSIQFVDKAFS